MKDQSHAAIQLIRVWVDEKLRYQCQCTCGRYTEIGSRQLAQMEQKRHRVKMRYA